MWGKHLGWIAAVSFILLPQYVAAEDVGQNTEMLLGKFRNTYYYSAVETDYPSKKLDETILDMEDKLISQVSKSYKKAVVIEGTGKLRDGRVINYAGKVNDMVRFHVTSHAFGHGIGNCALIPFRTIAVDNRKILLGSVVRIDETIGMVLPDGTTHDGLWKAEDVGGAIQGDRIDLFVGEGDQGEVLRKAGITTLKPLTVRLVTAPAERSCLQDTPL